MSDKYTFAILGGDSRQAVIARKIISRGHTAQVFGLNEKISEVIGVKLCASPEKAIKGAGVILLPLPVSRDGITLNYMNNENCKAVTLDRIIRVAHENGDTPILGGMIHQEIEEKAKEAGVLLLDYYKSEKLQLLNALPSAEGAIAAAMNYSDRVIEGMSILISGYGRIGRILAKKLTALGADVTVAARRDEVICELTMSGYKAVRIDDRDSLTNAIRRSQIIFNTVPCNVFTGSVLSECKHKPIYLEIASAPGGVDLGCARECGMNVYRLPSLPGKYAPVSAGEYIFEALVEILKQRGIDV